MKHISPEIKRQILNDIKEKYFKGSLSQKDLCLQYNVSNTTMKGLVDVALKEMADKVKTENEFLYKSHDSEEEVAKYGVPKSYRF